MAARRSGGRPHARCLSAAFRDWRCLARRSATASRHLRLLVFGARLLDFCSSQRTAISVTSAISLLVGSSLGALAGGDPARFGALAACTALLVAAIAFLAWLVRAGAIVNFISEPVMTGFKGGVALYLASTQLPKLFGFKGGEGSFWHRSAHFFSHLNETNLAALSVGGAALALLILGKIFLKNRPVGLFIVIGGIVAAPFLGLDAHGVKLLGDVPQGLPPLGLPAVHWADLNELLPLAIACFMLGAVETAAIGRMFAAKHGGRFDSNQEFLGLAAGNLAAGLGRAFPVSGGMSQSLVNEGGGARTPLSGLCGRRHHSVGECVSFIKFAQSAATGTGSHSLGCGGRPLQRF